MFRKGGKFLRNATLLDRGMDGGAERRCDAVASVLAPFVEGFLVHNVEHGTGVCGPVDLSFVFGGEEGAGEFHGVALFAEPGVVCGCGDDGDGFEGVCCSEDVEVDFVVDDVVVLDLSVRTRVFRKGEIIPWILKVHHGFYTRTLHC